MTLEKELNKIIIVDFGSQFTQLIARRIRELGVFSEIISHKKIKNKDIDKSIKGIILSGGPLNVYEIKKYSFDKKIIMKGLPVLGICFGHQILSKLNGGKVKQSKHREFGLANIYKKKDSLLIKKFFNNKKVNKVNSQNEIIDLKEEREKAGISAGNLPLENTLENSSLSFLAIDFSKNKEVNDSAKIFFASIG